MQPGIKLNKWKLFLFLISFALALALFSDSASALSCTAQAANQVTTYEDTLIVTTGTVNNLDGVSVYILESEVDKCSPSASSSVSSLQNAFQNFVTSRGVVDPANLNQLQTTLSGTPITITSLSNVKVSMFYKKGSVNIPLQCQNTGLSQLTISTPQTDQNGNPVTLKDSKGNPIPIFYGFCQVPKTDSSGTPIYSGTCTDIIAKYSSQSGSSAGSSRICDPKANSLSIFQDELRTALLPPSNVFDPKYDAFLFGFIVVGFLFATLYFTGRSPLSIMDITTPKLPSPKSLAASGQIVTPYGWSELKGTLNKKLNLNAKVFAMESAVSGSRPGFFLSSINEAVKAIKNNPRDQKFAKTFGTLVLEVSESVQRKAKLVELKPLISKNIGAWSDAEHGQFSKLLKQVDDAATGRQKYLARSLREYYLGTVQLQRLAVATGADDLTKKGKYSSYVETILGNTIGGSMFKNVGSAFTSTWGSGVRSTKLGGRFVLGTIGLLTGMTKGPNAKTAKKEGLTGQLLSAAGNRLEVGSTSPIAEKMAYMYQKIYEEAYRDISKYVIREVIKRYGIRFDISLKEIVEMGYKDVDILQKSGINARVLAELQIVETEITRVLKSDITQEQKAYKLRDIAKEHHVHLDPKVSSELTKLKQIDESFKQPGFEHIKLIALYEHLQSHHNSNKQNDNIAPQSNEFRYTIGKAVDQHSLWETFSLRRFMHDVENGFSAGKLKDSILATWLEVVNRLVTLNPLAGPEGRGMMNIPEFMREGDYQANFKSINNRVTKTLKELMTEEGKREFRALKGRDVELATFEELKDMLYGKESFYKDLKAKRAPWGGASGLQETPEGKIIFTGTDAEIGPRPEWWKVDMKRHWLSEMSDRESFALANWLQNRFTRNKQPVYDAEIDLALDTKMKADASKAGVNVNDRRAMEAYDQAHRVQEAKKLWMEKMVSTDLQNIFKSVFSSEAYQAHLQVPVYAKFAAGILAYALKEEGGRNIKTAEEIESLDITNRDHAQRLRELLTENHDLFMKQMNRKITYDELTRGKTPWVMLYEGGYVPYIPGMVVSDFDRIVGGSVAFKDKNGNWRRFDPGSVQVTLKDPEHKAIYDKLHDEANPKREIVSLLSGRSYNWKGFLKEIRESEDERVVAAITYRYANNTGDWTEVVNNIRIIPKKDAAPLQPQLVRYFTDKEFDFPLKLQPIRNWFLDAGHAISRLAFATGGPLHNALYEVNPYSEYYRLHSWRLSQDILTAKFNTMFHDVGDPQRGKELQAAYREQALAHGAYHQVWDVAIDRSPTRHSTSYGQHQSYGGFFHFGPANPYPLEMVYGADLTPWQRRSFNFHQGGIMKAALAVFNMPALMFNNIQRAIQGTAGRFDQTFNPLKPWNAGSSRTLEAFSSLNPFNVYDRVSIPQYRLLMKLDEILRLSKEQGNNIAGREIDLHKYLKKFGYTETSQIKGMLAGRDFGKGLSVAPQDIWFIREGVYSSARTGEANPGASMYDYRFTLQIDPAMAEFLAFRAAKQSSYFKEDKGIIDNAFRSTIRREVRAEYKALRSEEELRNFGPLNNPVYAWMGPFWYLWHSGGLGLLTPFMPSWSIRETAVSFVQKIKSGGSSPIGEIGKQIKEQGQKAKEIGERFFKVSKRGDVMDCPTCYTRVFRGNRCRKCNALIY